MSLIDLLIALLHLILISSILLLSVNTVRWKKIIIFLYLFYSVAVFFPFESEIFSYHLIYIVKAKYLLPYIFTDLFLLVILILDRKLNYKGIYSLNNSFKMGEKFLYFLCAFAVLNFYFQNIDFLFVSKNEYISNLSSLTPNLFFLSIPAEAILVGAGFYPPFSSVKSSRICFIIAIALTLVSFVMGYRHLLFLFLLMFIFKKKTRGVFIPLCIFSFLGEFSNVIKYGLLGYLHSDTFSFEEYFSFITSNISSYIEFSGEQVAILSNLVLGLPLLEDGEAMVEILNILPLASGFGVSWGDTTTNKIGQLVGLDVGQGVAYNFQLFVLDTYGIALALMALVFILIKFTHQTIFSILSVEVFYSLLRNAPAFYTGQIKMLILLVLMVIISDYFIKCFLKNLPRNEK